MDQIQVEGSLLIFYFFYIRFPCAVQKEKSKTCFSTEEREPNLSHFSFLSIIKIYPVSCRNCLKAKQPKEQNFCSSQDKPLKFSPSEESWILFYSLNETLCQSWLTAWKCSDAINQLSFCYTTWQYKPINNKDTYFKRNTPSSHFLVCNSGKKWMEFSHFYSFRSYFSSSTPPPTTLNNGEVTRSFWDFKHCSGETDI